MGSRLETIATSAVIVAALSVAGTSIYRTFAVDSDDAVPGLSAPRYVDDWRKLLDDGIVLGDSTASTTIIEFTDFECPFCRRFHDAIKRVRAARGSSLRFVLVHFPLPQHAFALPAARAAECAHSLGRFDQMQNVLFEQQDSLSSKSWGRFASDAGIPDTSGFKECVGDTRPVDRIQRGMNAGERLRVAGTPTVLINGWMYDALSPDSLEAEIERRSKGGRS